MGFRAVGIGTNKVKLKRAYHLTLSATAQAQGTRVPTGIAQDSEDIFNAIVDAAQYPETARPPTPLVICDVDPLDQPSDTSALVTQSGVEANIEDNPLGLNSTSRVSVPLLRAEVRVPVEMGVDVGSNEIRVGQ